MLLPIKRLLDLPIMSLQTGSELARVTEPIIDPRKLTIVALYVDGRLLTDHPSVLHVSDIREFSEIGLIVDDSDKLMASEGLVRLQEIIDFRFNIYGIKVVDERGHKLGKVVDYAIEPDGYTIQQIYTERSLIHNLSNVSNIIHRTQIISVTNQQIIVSSPTVKESLPKVEVAESTPFVNPFRPAPKPQHETIDQSSSDEPPSTRLMSS